MKTQVTQHPASLKCLAGLLVMLQIWMPLAAAALPQGGQVAGGQATVQQVSPNTLHIQQASDRAILNWQQFSIGSSETVQFFQPSVNAVALNRVIGGDPSVILGKLLANGRIFLVNPNGILFGAGAVVNVGGLLATTLRIQDSDFMAGRYNFTRDSADALRSVINRGEIRVSDHGFVALVAPGVANEGVIVANLGTAVLGSGERVVVDLMGDGLINYAISGKVLDQVVGPDGVPLSAAVRNAGTIQADGGQVILSAKASGDIFTSVVNQTGIIRARSLVNHGGVVKLIGGDEGLAVATEAGAMRPAGEMSGVVTHTGTIDVSAAEAGAAPGSVVLSGERVGQLGVIDARGAENARGGDVIVTSTERTVLSNGSLTDVSGIGNSSAGTARIWSDRDTFFTAGSTILARGGETGGNGGFVEVSGRETLGYAGFVDALAPHGAAGTLLLDPRNIIISAGGVPYTPGVNNLFANTPAGNVTITPASINASAANVVLQANNGITIANAIAMVNPGIGITMQAGRDILVNASVSTNNGAISMTANDSAAIAANRGAGTGDIIFAAGANLSAGTGNIALTIGPSAAAPFSPGSITTVRNLTTTTGNIAINSRNAVSLSGTVNAGSGTLTVNANTDGAGGQSFTMNAGSSITTTNTTAGAVQINVNAAGGGTGTAALRNITTGNGGTITVATNTGGNATGGDITQTAGTLLNVDSGRINLSTSTAAGMNIGTAGANILTRAGTISATSGSSGIFINNQTGVDLASIGTSGAFTLTANGAITQSGAVAATGTTTMAAGAANNITLNNAANNFSTVGVISGNNVNLRDANALILGASTVSGTLTVTANGALTLNGATVGGNLSLIGNSITLASAPISVTAGNATLSAATTLTQNVNLTTAGAGSVNVTSTTGAITMSPTATTSSGTGTINYTAGTDVILGALTTGGAVNVTAQGGSILSAGGAATHITAGANSTLQALGGTIGILAMPITVSVNPGSLGVAATAQVGGFSGVLTGTVLPSNTLTLLNTPPGCMSFNGACVTNSTGVNSLVPSVLTRGTFAYLNPDVIVPTFYEKASRSSTISRLTSANVPDSLLEPSSVTILGGSESVTGILPPSLPQNAVAVPVQSQ